LQIKFKENVLEDTSAYELHIIDKNDLSGLPAGIIEMAELEAKNRNMMGWVFTLHAPSYIPFMKYSDNRNLREHLFKAYGSRSFHKDSHDNRELAARIANLRLEMAILLGFKNFAGLALVDRMADSTENAGRGIFALAEKLYGIRFIPDSNIPIYHSDVKTWEVRDTDGAFLAILYNDIAPHRCEAERACPASAGGLWGEFRK
jgi:Zn-dependent oligopeptidase